LSRIGDNLRTIRDRIASAAARVGRAPEEVRVCAVTKNVHLEDVRQAVEQGCRLLGENRVQEAEGKIRGATDLAGRVSWHMIGHLQRNKARRAVELFDEIQSVDSAALARRLSSVAQERGKCLPILLEVLTSSEGTKWGIAIETLGDLVAEIRELPGLDLRGLMTMAPFTDDEPAIRASFGALREIRDRIGGAEILRGL
jgi:pyridoxal phosphate enzyme (YggS family)